HVKNYHPVALLFPEKLEHYRCDQGLNNTWPSGIGKGHASDLRLRRFPASSAQVDTAFSSNTPRLMCRTLLGNWVELTLPAAHSSRQDRCCRHFANRSSLGCSAPPHFADPCAALHRS